MKNNENKRLTGKFGLTGRKNNEKQWKAMKNNKILVLTVVLVNPNQKQSKAMKNNEKHWKAIKNNGKQWKAMKSNESNKKGMAG